MIIQHAQKSIFHNLSTEKRGGLECVYVCVQCTHPDKERGWKLDSLGRVAG